MCMDKAMKNALTNLSDGRTKVQKKGRKGRKIDEKSMLERLWERVYADNFL